MESGKNVARERSEHGGLSAHDAEDK
jgi:hypothetical protein